MNQLAYLQKATGLRYAAWTTVWDVRWVPHPGLAPAKQIGNVWSGNCILSRWPISRARHVRLPQPQAQVTSGWYNWLPVRDIYNRFYLHRHITDVNITLGPGLSLRVVNCHLEAFSAANRMEQATLAAELLLSGAQPQQDVPPYTVFLGDLNLGVQSRRPGQPPPPPDRTVELIAAVPGLAEAVPVGAAERRLTCPALQPQLALDRIFHGAGLAAVATEVVQMERPPSDHLPVVARLSIGPE